MYCVPTSPHRALGQCYRLHRDIRHGYQALDRGSRLGADVRRHSRQEPGLTGEIFSQSYSP